VAIGGSTGAPAVISQILTALPGDLRAPVLIVQHMARGFCTGFVEWLDGKTALRVKIAEAGERALPGCAYVAPDDRHLGIDAGGRLILQDGEPQDGFRPSISALFRSIAASRRHRAIGVILTGMGRDGVAGMLELKRAGGLTIAQDEQSCVVFGMPREAIRHEAADHVLMPSDIVAMIRATVLSKPQPSHV
jgi:two-component system chemotaxis response regulator CheB